MATGFPPTVALLVTQAYRGTRYLVAEDLLSEGILPARGILAGCAFATMMARVYLQPIMQEAAQLRHITALDTWVDDIGADFEARHPEQAAFAVYEGYKALRRLLEGSDLRLSLKKTGFLRPTAEAAGAPKAAQGRRPSLDCALARVRRVKVQRAEKAKEAKTAQSPTYAEGRGCLRTHLGPPGTGHATYPTPKTPVCPSRAVWQTETGQPGGGVVLRWRQVPGPGIGSSK